MSDFNFEQKQAIDLEKGKFVEANAGSGKTTVLTERFLNIIKLKIKQLSNYFLSQKELVYQIDNINNHFDSVSQINGVSYNIDRNEVENVITKHLKSSFRFDFLIVVSFTDNTANELMDKIKYKLESKQNNLIDNLKSKSNNNTTAHSEKQSFAEIFIEILIYNFIIENIENFQISTIHNFCNNIIAKSANLLKLDENYIKKDYFIEQTTKTRTFVIINDIKLLKFFAKEKGLLVNNETIDFERFHNIFLNLYKMNNSDDLFSFKNFIWKVSSGNSLVKLEESITFFNENIQILNKLTQTHEDIETKLLMFDLALDFNLDVKYFGEVVFAVLNAIYEENNFINFDNQIYKTYKLVYVEQNATRIAENIEYMLIDEFQDTDLIQYSIFKCLIDANKNMNVFFVGDPKQSIYRFRSSDITVFNNAKKHFMAEKRVESVILNQSYRNTPVISAFINTFYNEKFNQFSNSNNQYHYTNLIYPLGVFDDKEYNITNKQHISEKLENSTIEFNLQNDKLLPTLIYKDALRIGKVVYLTGFKTKNEDKKTKNEKLNTKNAHYLKLAEYIHELVEINKYQIEERDTNKKLITRNIEYKDIAILTKNNVKLDVLEEFEEYFKYYNIPFEIKKTKDFFNLQEIIDSIDFLSFINNHNDNEALIGLLMSNFYGFDLNSIFLLFEIYLLPNSLNEKNFDKMSLWEILLKLKFVNKEISRTYLLEFLENNQNDFNQDVVNQDIVNQDIVNQTYKDLENLYLSLLKVIENLEMYIILKSQVFSSELLTMFFKSNYNYQSFDQNKESYYENLNKFINILHEIEQTGYIQFHEVIAQLNIRKIDKEEEKINSIENENVVGFYTYHTSKGLEFPVVFVIQPTVNNKIIDLEIEKEFGLYNQNFVIKEKENAEFLDSHITNDNSDVINNKHNILNQKYENYIKHYSLFNDKKYFKNQVNEYKEIDKLNIDYVVMTRAKNLLGFVMKASRDFTKTLSFDGNDTNQWKGIDFNKNVSELKFEEKDGILNNLYSIVPISKETPVIFDYFDENLDLENKINNDNQNKNFKVNQINTRIFIDYYFYDYNILVEEFLDKKNKIQTIENDNEPNALENININVDIDINSIQKQEYTYNFETKYKTFSATKLMSLVDNKNKYEFKYLLGLNDEQSNEVEKLNFKEFDEVISDNKIVNDSKNNSHINSEIGADFGLNNQSEVSKKTKNNNIQNIEKAATFGKAFHYVIQYIVDLFPNKKLNIDYLNSIIIEIKNEYPNLTNSEIEKITEIIQKLSLSSLLDKIFEVPKSIKTEFAIKMKFLPSHFHYINGNLDLIFNDVDGNYHIIDWKTNSEKVEDSKYKYDLQRKLYTYMIQHFNPNAKVYFSLVYTQDILNQSEMYWETKFETEVIRETVELEINKLITDIIELETLLYE